MKEGGRPPDDGVAEVLGGWVGLVDRRRYKEGAAIYVLGGWVGGWVDGSVGRWVGGLGLYLTHVNLCDFNEGAPVSFFGRAESFFVEEGGDNGPDGCGWCGWVGGWVGGWVV